MNDFAALLVFAHVPAELKVVGHTLSEGVSIRPQMSTKSESVLEVFSTSDGSARPGGGRAELCWACKSSGHRRCGTP